MSSIGLTSTALRTFSLLNTSRGRRSGQINQLCTVREGAVLPYFFDLTPLYDDKSILNRLIGFRINQVTASDGDELALSTCTRKAQEAKA